MWHVLLYLSLMGSPDQHCSQSVGLRDTANSGWLTHAARSAVLPRSVVPHRLWQQSRLSVTAQCHQYPQRLRS